MVDTQCRGIWGWDVIVAAFCPLRGLERPCDISTISLGIVSQVDSQGATSNGLDEARNNVSIGLVFHENHLDTLFKEREVESPWLRTQG